MDTIEINVVGIEGLSRDEKGYWYGNVKTSIRSPIGTLDLAIPFKAASVDYALDRSVMKKLCDFGKKLADEAEICAAKTYVGS